MNINSFFVKREINKDGLYISNDYYFGMVVLYLLDFLYFSYRNNNIELIRFGENQLYENNDQIHVKPSNNELFKIVQGMMVNIGKINNKYYYGTLLATNSKGKKIYILETIYSVFYYNLLQPNSLFIAEIEKMVAEVLEAKTPVETMKKLSSILFRNRQYRRYFPTEDIINKIRIYTTSNNFDKSDRSALLLRGGTDFFNVEVTSSINSLSLIPNIFSVITNPAISPKVENDISNISSLLNKYTEVDVWTKITILSTVNPYFLSLNSSIKEKNEDMILYDCFVNKRCAKNISIISKLNARIKTLNVFPILCKSSIGRNRICRLYCIGNPNECEIYINNYCNNNKKDRFCECILAKNRCSKSCINTNQSFKPTNLKVTCCNQTADVKNSTTLGNLLIQYCGNNKNTKSI